MTDYRDLFTLLNHSKISFNSSVRKIISRESVELRRPKASERVDYFSLALLAITRKADIILFQKKPTFTGFTSSRPSCLSKAFNN